MAKLRYVLFPGYVRSRNDKDIHYIDACCLLRLYKVPPSARILVITGTRLDDHGFIPQPNDVILRPDHSGRYEQPQAMMANT